MKYVFGLLFTVLLWSVGGMLSSVSVERTSIENVGKKRFSLIEEVPLSTFVPSKPKVELPTRTEVARAEEYEPYVEERLLGGTEKPKQSVVAKKEKRARIVENKPPAHVRISSKPNIKKKKKQLFARAYSTRVSKRRQAVYVCPNGAFWFSSCRVVYR